MERKSEKGVTLVALVITIIILIIISSIGIMSGKGTIESAKYSQFMHELIELQTKVNELNQNGDTEIGRRLTDEQKEIFNNSVITEIIYNGKTEDEQNKIKDGFRYCNKAYIKQQLGIETEREYLINVEYRYIIYKDGYEYDGTTYYMPQQVNGTLYNVEYNNKNEKNGDFEINTTSEKDKCKIEITNINYDGYINDWQVKYKLRTSNQWNTSDNLSFYISNQGVYDIKVVHGDEIELGTKTQAIVFSDVLTDTVNSDYVKVGDYVQYTPDSVTNTDKSYTDLISNLKTYSGNTDSTKNTTSAITQEKNLNWRVLDVKDGQVRLISEEPVTSARIALQGYNGYNNAVKLLDDACNTLYCNATLASKVQNLKIEDIQDKMIEKDYSKISSEYGIYGSTDSPTNKYYPSILSKEKGQIVNGKEGTELDLSEQKEFINQTTSSPVNSWTVKFTSWEKVMVEEDFSNEKYYEMFLNNKTRYYWISSRCALVSSSYAHFDVRFINNGSVTAANLYHSGNGERSANNYLRPVITLNADVQLDTNDTTKDGTSASKAWIIKN